MKKLIFTAHNIRLDNLSNTIDNSSKTVDSYDTFLSARNILNLVFPGNKTGVKIVDLGCLEGGYTVEFARLGFDALGIEVRDSNFECCNYVKHNVNLPNLKFVQDNVINIEKYGIFDAAFCSGLLYHLDKPRQFLEKLSIQTNRVIILQTHFSLSHVDNSDFMLSPMTLNEGLPGRFYKEFDSNISRNEIELSRWASFHNSESFWIQREYLIGLLYDLGFSIVFEQFDSNRPIDLINYYEKRLRGTFVGIKN